MTRAALIAPLLTLALAGCGVMDRFEASLEEAGIARFTAGPRCAGMVRVSVAPETGRGGTGAVVGPNTVLTVAHVLAGSRTAWVMVGQDGGWATARVLRELPSSPENLVLLEVAPSAGGALFGFEGFDADRVLTCAPGLPPERVGCPAGTWRWKSVDLRPGDSGSPVLSGDGELVGLVTGRRDGQPVMSPLPAESPAVPAELTLARIGR